MELKDKRKIFTIDKVFGCVDLADVPDKECNDELDQMLRYVVLRYKTLDNIDESNASKLLDCAEANLTALALQYPEDKYYINRAYNMIVKQVNEVSSLNKCLHTKRS